MVNIIYKNYNYCRKQEQQKIKRIYECSFPKEEKFPFWILSQCSKEDNVHLEGIIDLETYNIIGMRFIVSYDDIDYLMYLAINKNDRNKGFGSVVLRDLIVHKVDTTVLLCIEKPSNDVNDMKVRRKNFYLRNGFYETGTCIEDTGIEYEFLASSKDRVITENDLYKRYLSMSRHPLIKCVIKKSFDININIIK